MSAARQRWARFFRQVADEPTSKRGSPTDPRDDKARRAVAAKQLPVALSPPGALRSSRLEARLLGSFELLIDGREVREWRGQRGLTVLKFILASPKRSRRRDVLLDQFWPGVDPTRARNRLHVAVSSVRRTVRAAGDINIIEHRDGNYQIPNEVELTVDLDRFEALIDEGRGHEVDGKTDLSISAFSQAAGLYRGDFLADDPFAEWALITREALRMSHLDLLDRLAQLYWSAGSLGECVNIAQRILTHDSCREDAHRLLMRAAAQHGRTSEVRRQYELCQHVLADRLGIAPSPATTRLYVTLVNGSNRQPPDRQARSGW